MDLPDKFFRRRCIVEIRWQLIIFRGAKYSQREGKTQSGREEIISILLLSLDVRLVSSSP